MKPQESWPQLASNPLHRCFLYRVLVNHTSSGWGGWGTSRTWEFMYHASYDFLWNHRRIFVPGHFCNGVFCLFVCLQCSYRTFTSLKLLSTSRIILPISWHTNGCLLWTLTDCNVGVFVNQQNGSPCWTWTEWLLSGLSVRCCKETVFFSTYYFIVIAFRTLAHLLLSFLDYLK